MFHHFEQHHPDWSAIRLRGVLTVTAAVAALALCACGSSSSTSSSNAAASSTSVGATHPLATVPSSELVSSGHLTMCTNAPAPPTEVFNSSGVLVGSDIDTGDAIAGLLGLKPAWVQTSFDTIIEAMDTGKCDLIVSGMFITPVRLKQIDFVPYYQVREGLLMQKGNPQHISDDWQTLCGKTISVQIGDQEQITAQGYSGKCKAAGKSGITLITSQEVNTALQAVVSGQAAAFFYDSPLVQYYVHKSPGEFTSGGPGVLPVQYGIGVSKNHPNLLSGVVLALKKLEQDGAYTVILKKWGLSPAAVPPATADTTSVG
jgi:polar amino acid transport system substrate-binding protein